MKVISCIVCLATILGCGGDKSTDSDDDQSTDSVDEHRVASGEEIVGTWVLVSTTDTRAQDMEAETTYFADGTLESTVEIDGEEHSFSGTWRFSLNLLNVSLPSGENTATMSGRCYIKGDTLRIEWGLGGVEVYQRKPTD